LDDGEFATILKGIKKLRDFKKIVYRYNSLKELESLLVRKIPNHLEELRLENCQISLLISNQLLHKINRISYLSRLSLVNAHLNDESFSLLCKILLNNEHLVDLDISHNSFKPTSFVRMFEVLSQNSVIQYLNLSHNSIIESGEPVDNLHWKHFNQQALVSIPVSREMVVDAPDPDKDQVD
jgi:Ran GTPase-activating protein (RanGAP) involved in mRNA processing and transport